MIVKTIRGAGEGIDVMKAEGPPDADQAFGRLDVLRYTSAELGDRFGIGFAEHDVHTVFELVEALRSNRGEATAVRIPKRDIAHLIDKRPSLLPCFVGYQEVPRIGVLPFMTDGHRSRWSLFFDARGAMTLVENLGDHLRVTPHAALGLPPPRAERPGLADRLSRFLRGRSKTVPS